MHSLTGGREQVGGEGDDGAGEEEKEKEPKKKEKDNSDKPKRPMNGFMLFAKKYRLELIQQHPGKDNR